MFISSQIILFPLQKNSKNEEKKSSPCNNLLFTLENRQLFILVQALFYAFQNTKLTRNISLWVLRPGMKAFQNGLKAIFDFLWKSTFSGNLN